MKHLILIASILLSGGFASAECYNSMTRVEIDNETADTAAYKAYIRFLAYPGVASKLYYGGTMFELMVNEKQNTMQDVMREFEELLKHESITAQEFCNDPVMSF